jgi:tRNA (guanosine-2'-O-)-methyltransferase
MPADPRLIEFLSQFVTDARRNRMEAALAQRTRYLTVALEDIYQSHNASAVLRSCDGLGIQDVHVIENRNPYKVNPDVALGTSQWLTIHTYRDGQHNTRAAFDEMRRRGYRVVATAPHRGDIDLEDFAIEEGPVALVFGNELDGLTDVALDNADAYLRIPMRGFVDSFNISVSAALCMHHLTHRMRSRGVTWQLSETEARELRLSWLRRSIRRSDALEAQYHECN